MKTNKAITASNNLQSSYSYQLEEPEGKNFDPNFKPMLTPKEMLELGVFGGRYLNSAQNEYPASWFASARLSDTAHANKELNYFGVHASASRSYWYKKGWIHPDDPRGWFEWYCRYYLGRRHADDARQISRWKNMKRHIVQLQNACTQGDEHCQIRRRQALLHWAYDSRVL